MQRRIDVEIDREFQLHTSYHNDFFLLRTKVLVDGKSTEIRSVEEGGYEGPVLKVCHSGSTSSTKLWRIANTISPILHQCGVYHVDTFYYEQSPLFHTVFTSESCLRKFLLAMEEIKSALETQLHYLLSRNLKSTQCHIPEADSPQQLTIEVQPELFLVSPNQQKTKGADLHLITIENCSDHLTHWKSSKLFEFSSLYQEEVVPPKITTHPKELTGIFPGKTASFTLQATGTGPLKYQWQWKPDGEKKGSEEWQSISCDGGTFQQVEAGGLKLTDVQACNAGYYRCVVSNSAGSATSQFANLVIAVPPKITTHPKELMGIFPGKTASFTVQATGMEPLKYQWQWKPEGEKGSEEWQNISCDGGTFQQVEAGGLKLTDVQACNAGHYRCVVSNSAGSATSQSANLLIAAELLDLVNELQEVNNWIPFGLNLGIDISRLEAIEKERATIEEHRTQLFIYWQKQVVPTWSAVVKALINIGMRRLALKVAQKHGVPVPERSDDEALEQLTNLSQQGETSATRSELLAEVQKRSVDIRKVDVEMIDTKKRLGQSQKSKASIDENVNQILCSLSELQRKVESIAHERNITKDKLESKQQERQLLSEMEDVLTESMQDHQKQHQRFWKKDQEKERQLQEKKVTYRTLLERIIAKKGRKIEKLEEELQHKDSELRSAKQEARSLDEKLSQARAELKMKHEEVKQLQKENEELTCSYNIEKEQVSKLVQIAATLTADKEKIEQQLISTKDESELKSQQIEACNSSITSLSEKVETLSCTLKEKESTAAQLQGELQSSHHLVSSTTEQLLELLKLQPQIVELERQLQEAEYKHQQAVLKKRAVVQEMEARKKLEVQLCAQLDLTTRVKTEESETHLHKELQTPLKLRWKKRSNMLYGMSSYPKTVQLHNNLYVGGGDSDSISEMCTVLKYDQFNDTWSKLPKYGCWLFGMSAINGYLTVVGGRDIATLSVSKEVGVWKPSSQRWTQPYPPMITPRTRPEVATYNNYLLAAGGVGDGFSPLTTVEVLDVRDGRQWLTVTQLPVPCGYKTSAIIQDNWYVITDSKEVLSTYLPALCQTASKSAATDTPARWQRLSDTPLGATTAIALSGSLLTVGGRHDNTASTAIHLYHPETNTWTEVGNLPTPRCYCSATVLASGELLVSGGRDQQDKLTTLVDIATILD